MCFGVLEVLLAPSKSVVIVGAGITGISLAYELSRRPGLSVTVVELAADVAMGVTSLGSGGLRTQFAEPEEALLSLRTLELWDRLAHDENVDLGLRHNGYLVLGSTPAAARKIERDAEFQRTLGVDVRLLDQHETATILPGVSVADVEVAALTPRDGYGTPVAIARLLREMAERHGAHFRFGHPIDTVLENGGAVSGVVVPGETIAADAVVDAAGLDAPAVSALVDLALPVAAWRQHQYESVPLAGSSPEAFPCFLDPANDLYFRPLGIAALVGYAEADEASHRDYGPSPVVRDDALLHLAKRWPAAATGPFVREWVGCYEVTPDRRALVGEHPSLSGFYYAAGFSGHGFMHSMATAEALADLIVGRKPAHVDLSVFSAARFLIDGAPTTAPARTDAAW